MRKNELLCFGVKTRMRKVSLLLHFRFLISVFFLCLVFMNKLNVWSETKDEEVNKFFFFPVFYLIL